MSTLQRYGVSLIITFASLNMAYSDTGNMRIPVVASLYKENNQNNFAEPTLYSSKLIDDNSMLELDWGGYWYKWIPEKQKFPGEQHNIANDKLKECAAANVKDTILPFLNAKGYKISSLEEGDLYPESDQKEMGLALKKNEAMITITSATYLINCMVSKGYYFKRPNFELWDETYNQKGII